DPSTRAVQTLRRGLSARRSGSGRPRRNRLRLPRTERRRQDHRHPLPARLRQTQRRVGGDSWPRYLAGWGQRPPRPRVPGPPGRLLPRHDRPRPARLPCPPLGQAARVARSDARRSGAGRRRPRPPHRRLLQGHETETGPGRRLPARPRAADPRRADRRSRSIDPARFRGHFARASGPGADDLHVLPRSRRGGADLRAGGGGARRALDRRRNGRRPDPPQPADRPRRLRGRPAAGSGAGPPRCRRRARRAAGRTGGRARRQPAAPLSRPARGRRVEPLAAVAGRRLSRVLRGRRGGGWSRWRRRRGRGQRARRCWVAAM
ncbi:MAG: Thioredoxin reductase, partial [uncultured Thermomicrobiales bacterium]